MDDFDLMWDYNDEFGTRVFGGIVGGLYVETEEGTVYEVPKSVSIEDVSKMMREGLEQEKDILKEKICIEENEQPEPDDGILE